MGTWGALRSERVFWVGVGLPVLLFFLRGTLLRQFNGA